MLPAQSGPDATFNARGVQVGGLVLQEVGGRRKGPVLAFGVVVILLEKGFVTTRP
jgi:hypothetical protein